MQQSMVNIDHLICKFFKDKRVCKQMYLDEELLGEYKLSILSLNRSGNLWSIIYKYQNQDRYLWDISNNIYYYTKPFHRSNFDSQKKFLGKFHMQMSKEYKMNLEDKCLLGIKLCIFHYRGPLKKDKYRNWSKMSIGGSLGYKEHIDLWRNNSLKGIFQYTWNYIRRMDFDK